MVGIPPEADMLRRMLSQLYGVQIDRPQAYQVRARSSPPAVLLCWPQGVLEDRAA
jgi:hypothetical protein